MFVLFAQRRFYEKPPEECYMKVDKWLNLHMVEGFLVPMDRPFECW